MFRVQCIYNVYLDGKAVTNYAIYELHDDLWLLQEITYVRGHWKKPQTVAAKHCLKNGVKFNPSDWKF